MVETFNRVTVRHRSVVVVVDEVADVVGDVVVVEVVVKAVAVGVYVAAGDVLRLSLRVWASRFSRTMCMCGAYSERASDVSGAGRGSECDESYVRCLL